MTMTMFTFSIQLSSETFGIQSPESAQLGIYLFSSWDYIYLFIYLENILFYIFLLLFFILFYF